MSNSKNQGTIMETDYTKSNISGFGIPFKCRFNYLRQLINDEVEFFLMIPYLFLLMNYSFWINLGYYVPAVKFIA